MHTVQTFPRLSNVRKIALADVGKHLQSLDNTTDGPCFPIHKAQTTPHTSVFLTNNITIPSNFLQ